MSSRLLLYVFFGPFIVSALLLLLSSGDAAELLGTLHYYLPVLDVFRYVVLTKEFGVVLGATLLLQLLIPARKSERIFSVSFFQDAIWFVYENALHFLVLLTYVAWLSSVFKEHLPWLSIGLLADAPTLIRLLVGVLLTDLLYWLQHYLNHKIPMLWAFHKLHHSQRELNFFTDYRYHFVEYLVRHTILTIPFLILNFEIPIIVAVAFFQRWYSRFYHANLRTNLGPLRYLLVTPQSHRVHHSLDLAHRDRNFGALLSIWDYLFGTQVRSYDIYPETGLADDRFPIELEAAWWELPILPLVQMLQPFRDVLRPVYIRARALDVENDLSR